MNRETKAMCGCQGQNLTEDYSQEYLDRVKTC
jgi:hypothetical protein